EAPKATPSAAITPVAGPPRPPMATMNIMSGPGVTQRMKAAAANAASSDRSSIAGRYTPVPTAAPSGGADPVSFGMPRVRRGAPEAPSGLFPSARRPVRSAGRPAAAPGGSCGRSPRVGVLPRPGPAEGRGGPAGDPAGGEQ